MNCDIDISGTILHTERLTLRPWKTEDLDDFYEYASVDGVGQMAGWLPHKNKEESAQILQHFIDGKHTFALEYRGKAVGSLGIEEYDEKQLPEFDELKCREIGFVLSREYWGHGLMAEAVREVLKYLFETVGTDAVFCTHDVTNMQSARVQEKAGFHFYAGGMFHTRMNTDVRTKINIIYRVEYEQYRKRKMMLGGSPVKQL